MADHSIPQIHAVALRIAELAENGALVPGDDNVYVSGALVLATITPVYADGTEVTDRNAADEVCLDYKAPDSFRRVDVQLELCTPDPILSAFFSGTLLGDPSDPDNALGWAMPPIGVLAAKQVSVELFARRINNGVLDPVFPYAQHVLPFTNNWRLGAKQFGAARQPHIFTGQGYENTLWFDGPANDWPFASDRAYQWAEVESDSLPDTFGALELVAS